jgi:ADP-heptose:LPS heptosyltransferase
MTWSKETSKGNEASKCRHRVLPFLRGIGVDIGCGPDKIHHKAIGVDKNLGSGICHTGENLPMFADGSLDYVFSSHCLEDLGDTEAILKEWWRVLKVGGHLVLYLPHKDLYPNVGQPGANPAHIHDFVPDDILTICRKNFCCRLIRNDTHAEADEYSFELVIQKKAGPPGMETALQTTPDNSCLIVRYGAFGDAIQVTPIIRRVKEEGFFVVVQTSTRGGQILKNNPHIDRLEILEEGALQMQDLPGFWEKSAQCYKRFINLSGIVEQFLLKIKNQPGYDMPDKLRRMVCNVNYLEAYTLMAGYEDVLPYETSEIYFTTKEENWAKKVFEKIEATYLVLWSLAGSGWNKKYPWGEMVQRIFLETHPNAAIITVGDESCKIIEWEHPRLIRMSGKTTMRQSCLLTKYVDLVVGAETGVLNAASCYDTPKIILLSHSSPENLTKYWQNVTNLQPECDCSPCHKLVYVLEECPKALMDIEKKDILRFIIFVKAAAGVGMSIESMEKGIDPWQNQMAQVPEGKISMEYLKCMVGIDPERVFNAMEAWYGKTEKDRETGRNCKGIIHRANGYEFSATAAVG